jgi:hypothetical protein
MFVVELYNGVTNCQFLEPKEFVSYRDAENYLRAQPRHVYGGMYELQKVVFITRNKGWTQPEGSHLNHREPTYEYETKTTVFPLNHWKKETA